MNNKDKQKKVYTPLGEGRVVYQLPDGTLLVEFSWGGGKLFLPSEIMGNKESQYVEFQSRNQQIFGERVP